MPTTPQAADDISDVFAPNCCDPSDYPHRLLRRGDRGLDVVRVQEALNHHLPFTTPFRDVVVSWHAKVVHDCVAGLHGGPWDCAPCVQAAVGGLAGSHPSVWFHVLADGVFGAQTEAAVKDFQKRNGLSASGIVDEPTWDALFPPCRLRLRTTFLDQKCRPLFSALGMGQCGPGRRPSSQDRGNKNTNDNASPTPPAPPKPKGDDGILQAQVGIQTDRTLYVQAQFLLAKHRWDLIGRDIEHSLSYELDVPYASKTGYKFQIQYQLQVDNIISLGDGILTTDGFAQVDYVGALDKGTASDPNPNNFGGYVGLTLKLDFGKMLNADWLHLKLGVQPKVGEKYRLDTHKLEFDPGGAAFFEWDF